MSDQLIQSLHNSQVKQWMKLHTRKGRQEAGRYIIEGIHLVEEAITSKVPLETLIYDQERGIPASLQQVLAANPVQRVAVTPQIIAKLSDTQTPQGIMAVVKATNRQWSDWWRQMSAGRFTLLLLDELQDPGNLGTILRTAEAAGIDGVILGSGCVDLYNPKVVRATMGSLFRLPIFSLPLPEAAQAVRSAGGQLLVTSLEADSHPYDAPIYGDKVAVVIGNEARGVSAEMKSLASAAVHIPLYGPVESLNAAVATGIILYEVRRQLSQ